MIIENKTQFTLECVIKMVNNVNISHNVLCITYLEIADDIICCSSNSVVCPLHV